MRLPHYSDRVILLFLSFLKFGAWLAIAHLLEVGESQLARSAIAATSVSAELVPNSPIPNRAFLCTHSLPASEGGLRRC